MLGIDLGMAYFLMEYILMLVLLNHNLVIELFRIFGCLIKVIVS